MASAESAAPPRRRRSDGERPSRRTLRMASAWSWLHRRRRPGRRPGTRTLVTAAPRDQVGARGRGGPSSSWLGGRGRPAPGRSRGPRSRRRPRPPPGDSSMEEQEAATRSLLNTARLIEQSPVLLRLKELEAAERVAAQVGSIQIVGMGMDACWASSCPAVTSRACCPTAAARPRSERAAGSSRSRRPRPNDAGRHPSGETSSAGRCLIPRGRARGSWSGA